MLFTNLFASADYEIITEAQFNKAKIEKVATLYGKLFGKRFGSPFKLVFIEDFKTIDGVKGHGFRMFNDSGYAIRFNFLKGSNSNYDKDNASNAFQVSSLDFWDKRNTALDIPSLHVDFPSNLNVVKIYDKVCNALKKGKPTEIELTESSAIVNIDCDDCDDCDDFDDDLNEATRLSTTLKYACIDALTDTFINMRANASDDELTPKEERQVMKFAKASFMANPQLYLSKFFNNELDAPCEDADYYGVSDAEFERVKARMLNKKSKRPKFEDNEDLTNELAQGLNKHQRAKFFKEMKAKGFNLTVFSSQDNRFGSAVKDLGLEQELAAFKLRVTKGRKERNTVTTKIENVAAKIKSGTLDSKMQTIADTLKEIGVISDNTHPTKVAKALIMLDALSNAGVNNPEQIVKRRESKPSVGKPLASSTPSISSDVDNVSLDIPLSKGPSPKLDLALPDVIPDNMILQNRNRTNQASVEQMRHIADTLDFFRVSTSHDFNSGAPVVSYGTYDDVSFGNTSVLVMPDGKRITVQYAIAEADSILTSNDAWGNTDDRYSSNNPTHKRAIAGNGRLAAIKEAYKQNSKAAQNYKQDLIDNADMTGTDPDAIRAMDKPVLIRVMQPKDITSDIGDKTNISQGAGLNAVEQARNDMERLNLLKGDDFDSFETYENGTPTVKSVEQFIALMPRNERISLYTDDGQPTKQAQDRLQNALVMKAYNNDHLVKLKAQALDPNAQNVINGLTMAASAFAKLDGLGEYDIRYLINPIVDQFTRYTIQGGASFKWEAGLGIEDTDNPKDIERMKEIGRLIADNRRSAKKIGELFKLIANTLAKAAHDKAFSSSQGSLMDFDDDVKDYMTPDEALETALNNFRAGILDINQNSQSDTPAETGGSLFDLDGF